MGNALNDFRPAAAIPCFSLHVGVVPYFQNVEFRSLTTLNELSISVHHHRPSTDPVSPHDCPTQTHLLVLGQLIARPCELSKLRSRYFRYPVHLPLPRLLLPRLLLPSHAALLFYPALCLAPSPRAAIAQADNTSRDKVHPVSSPT